MCKIHNKYHGTAPADAVYIGRGSEWGNPFVIDKDNDRNSVCNKHLQLIIANPKLIPIIREELTGKDLLCFCAPARCHGEAYLIVTQSNDDEEALSKLKQEKLKYVQN